MLNNGKFPDETQRFCNFTSYFCNQSLSMDKRIFVFLWCLLFAGVFCACNKNDVEEKWAKEEVDLAEWMKENKPDALFDNDIYIEKIVSRGEDFTQPETGDHVLVNFVCSFLYEHDGDVERVSYKDGKDGSIDYKPQQLSLYKEGGPELWEPKYWESMGVGLLREKERANIYIPSRKLNLPDFKPRVFMIELVQVIETDLKTHQEKLMDYYMKKRYCNKFDSITIKDNGRDYYVIYHVDEEGTGSAVNVSNVNTHYDEHYFLQDDKHKECVKNKAKTGWDKKFSEMFQSVKKGGKLTVVMPYRIMFGDDPYTDKNSKQYIAPSGSVLRYDITIDP